MARSVPKTSLDAVPSAMVCGPSFEDGVGLGSIVGQSAAAITWDAMTKGDTGQEATTCGPRTPGQEQFRKRKVGTAGPARGFCYICKGLTPQASLLSQNPGSPSLVSDSMSGAEGIICARLCNSGKGSWR